MLGRRLARIRRNGRAQVVDGFANPGIAHARAPFPPVLSVALLAV